MAKSNPNKKSSWKRSIIEYAIISGIVFFLYLSGYYVEVVGRMQQVLLWTGLMQPDIEQPVQGQKKVNLEIPLISLSGSPTNLNQYRGKVIFINFWATWCPPCVAEMPNIQTLYDQYADNSAITFVMISLDSDVMKAENFIQKKDFTFPVFMLNGRRPPELQSDVIPSTFVINKEGRIATSRHGMAKYNTHRFIAFLDSLIAQ